MKLFYILILLYTPSLFADTSFVNTLKDLILEDPDFQKTHNLKDYKSSLKTSAGSKLILPRIDFTTSKTKDNSVFSANEVESQLSKLSLKYSLFSFGSDFTNFQSQSNYLNAYQEELTQTVLSKEKELATLLLLKIKVLKGIEIQNEIIKLKEGTYKISKTKFKRGSLSKNDLTRVKLDLTNSKSELLSLKEESFKIQAQLSAYGVNTNKITQFPWVQFFKQTGLKRVEGLNFKEKNIPSLQRYHYLAEANRQTALSQKLAHLGRFSINYSRDLYQTDDSSDLYGWSTSIVYTLPLFENFDRHKRVQEARANERTAQTVYSYQKRHMTAQLELKKTYLNLAYQNFQDRISILKDSNSLFKNVLSRFKKGVLSVNDLFIEQDRLLKTKKLTNNATYNLHLTYLDYIHYFGFKVTENTNLVN